MLSYKPIIIKYEISGISIFKNQEVSIDFLAQDNVYEGDKLFLHQLGESNFYYSPVISLVGVNSSGKTTILSLLSAISLLHGDMQALGRTWINSDKNKNSLLDDRIVLTSYTYFSDHLIKTSTFLESEKSITGTNVFNIVDETLSVKKITNITKRSIYHFDESMVVYSREKLEKDGVKFSNDLSVISYYFESFKPKKNTDVEKKNWIRKLPRPTLNLSVLLDSNLKLIFNDIDIDFAKYLDPSIEELIIYDSESSNSNPMYKFKTYYKDEFQIIDSDILSSILSSGTRRGLNVIEGVKITLKMGGVIFIDVIESNLNKSIVNDLLKLFYSKKTNPFGAVLIFSTHYTEILDFVKRKDSIYVLEKGIAENKNQCVNFSDSLQRNDLKKSEAYISNNLSIVSAPQKKYFDSLRKNLIKDLKSQTSKEVV